MAETKTSLTSLIYKDVKKGIARASYDKRFESVLRRGAGRLPEQANEAFAAVCENVSDEFIASNHKGISIPLKAEYIALTLAVETKDSDSNSQQSFARAMGRLSKVDNLSEQGVINEFQKILRSKETKELISHLYGAVKLLENNRIRFDFADFAANFLFGILSPKSRDAALTTSWEEFERGRRSLKENTDSL